MSDAVARNSLLVLLAEDPVPGRVLARLATVLGEARAAALYDAFAADAIRAALDAGCCDTLVALAPGSSGAWLDRIAPEVPRWNRRGDDEGARRQEVLEEAARLGYDRAAILQVGTPELRSTWVEAAFAALARRSTVIAPDGAGGYSFLGVTGSPNGELFRDMPFGQPNLLERTETRIWALGIDYERLPELRAVATSTDVNRLRAELAGLPPRQRPAATAKALGID